MLCTLPDNMYHFQCKSHSAEFHHQSDTSLVVKLRLPPLALTTQEQHFPMEPSTVCAIAQAPISASPNLTHCLPDSTNPFSLEPLRSPPGAMTSETSSPPPSESGVKRGRGRPRKSVANSSTNTTPTMTTRRRGRPRKEPSYSTAESASTISSQSPTASPTVKRPRGRPRKSFPAESSSTSTTKRPRGRPPKQLHSSPQRRSTRRKRSGGSSTGSSIPSWDDDTSSDSSSTSGSPRMTSSTVADTSTRCFMCYQILPEDPFAVNEHIDRCLNQQGMSSMVTDGITTSGTSATPLEQPGLTPASNGTTATPVNGIGPSSSTNNFVTYSWAGETRVRATALVQGGANALTSGPTVTMRKHQDVEGDLDIDEDALPSYGAAQYTDKDIQRVMHRRKANTSTRGLTSQPLSAASISSSHANVRDNSSSLAAESTGFEVSPLPPPTPSEIRQSQWSDPASAPGQTGTQLVIESLKAKIHEQEELVQSVQTCLICMEPYDQPVVSTVCWHVHCERCWLQTLATKKLCPQCQVITQPTDLRRIYL
ncbi:hypothetical protein IWQ62_004563 [Dispira parvispora]|uniref:RING-type domain-containing protein n=1 Tax=Dispira parvispora TaxID=1520584 RepID=A0A9W8AKK6_9FUNG|nr:hypothetical protein IWQ62_004563 [Dispira parvispora]